ncbi:Multidrug/Oligosaccharidyl-lipid/Polysaccharide (MOP) Flippase Superfamily [Achlya hypogyna]|uniref:Multidrug/Oligosaccharidyl-lipid/Polysaccharide (MOP) Flippase Superfamily n=1 Tax=Achlya hypogyna TaxID=1202772 RepID=A0A1V9YD07_ACHHY|nr:Multidrug/Oligosaccharidyl-lipid/Polysaccharide (MOP) Flippase Superfamily [Achlya hypogyna]
MVAMDDSRPLLAPTTDSVDLWAALPQFTFLAVQVALANITRIALLTIDNAFLGHLGATSLAAASLSATWIQVPLFTVWAMSSALVTLCGQAYGAGNLTLMGIWLQMALLLVTVLAMPVAGWYLSVGTILTHATDDAAVVGLGARFARLLSLSIWPTLVYACLRQYLQAMHIVAPTTANGVAAIVLTVGANYFLIYTAGLGFDGSPLATVVASWFQPAALFLYCFAYKQYHQEAWGGWKFAELTRARWRTFLRMAVPLGANDGLTYLANSTLSLVVASLGVEVLAANAILLTLWVMLWALSFGVGCATQVSVATHLGGGRPRAAYTTSCLGLVVSLGTATTTVVLLYWTKHTVLGVFTSDSALIAHCTDVLPLYLLAYALDSLEITLTATLNGMGQMPFVSMVTFVGMWGVQLPMAYLVAIYWEYGLRGVWIGYAATATFKLSVLGIKYCSVDWGVMAKNAVAAMEVDDEVRPGWHVECAVPSPVNAVFEVTPDVSSFSHHGATSCEAK